MYGRKLKTTSTARRPTSATLAALRAGSRAVQIARARGYAQRPAVPRSMPVLAYVPRASTRQTEVKGMDTDISLAPVIDTTNTNASSFVLNLVQQGAGSWNRVGRKIYPKSLRFKGNFNFEYNTTVATGHGSDSYIRFAVIYDQQPSGALPTFDTIFGITDQTGTEACTDVTNPPRYDNMDRFKILLDKTVVPDRLFVTSGGAAPHQDVVVPFDYFLKLPQCETVFSGQSNPMTIADISSGGLYLYLRAYQNSSEIKVDVDGIARLRYNDN